MRAMWVRIREKLDSTFAPDTASPGTPVAECSSAGHCAVVAIILYQLCGGVFKSTIMHGKSHWYNRIDGIDVDLTGDQFGLPTVNLGKDLYPGSKVRDPKDLDDATIDRAYIFGRRLGYHLERFKRDM